MADLKNKDETRDVFEVCINEKERRSQNGGLSICKGYYNKNNEMILTYGQLLLNCFGLSS
jgi:hypothetical protein